MIQSKIREILDKDIDEVSVLCQRFLSKKWDKKQIEYEKNGNEFSHLLVATIDDKIVGFLDYWITFDSSTICEIVVDKNFRKKGIASSLLNEMIIDLKNNNVLTSTLEVRKSNANAINLYKKFGYETVTIKEHYYDDKEDALYMVKGVY